jgi:hypothetical protein
LIFSDSEDNWKIPIGHHELPSLQLLASISYSHGFLLYLGGAIRWEAQPHPETESKTLSPRLVHNGETVILIALSNAETW